MTCNNCGNNEYYVDGTGLGGSFGGASGSGQFSSQVSQFTPSSSGSYSIGQYGTNTSSMFGG